ncbi:MAG TPA: hypothetical protein VGO22_20525, partial [Pseudorhizobium sp.]|nr:hypothetical protein [Pseudorhizobium sp.]
GRLRFATAGENVTVVPDHLGQIVLQRDSIATGGTNSGPGGVAKAVLPEELSVNLLFLHPLLAKVHR